MKINAIQINNVLGIKQVSIQDLPSIALFAGANGAGKSSIAQAVAMALFGEIPRVSLKKDFGKLVRKGQKRGSISVEYQTQSTETATISLPSGECSGSFNHGALPFCLAPEKFAQLEEKPRRDFLFRMTGVKISADTVAKKLAERGIQQEQMEFVLPLLAGGFDVASKEAAAQATQAKGEWRAITGETYGSQKAETWEAPAINPEPGARSSTATHEQLKSSLAQAQEELSAAQFKAGEVTAQYNAHKENASKIEGLQKKAQAYASIQQKLIIDEDQLKVWQAKVEAAKLAKQQHEEKKKVMHCPTCNANLVHENGKLVYASYDEPDIKFTEDFTRLEEYEKALRLMENSVANGRRDLDAANAAAEALAAIKNDKEELPSEDGVTAVKLLVTIKTQLVEKIRCDLRQLESLTASTEAKAKEAKSATERAAKAHAAVCSWQKVAEALGPTGIPAEFLAEAVEPFNRLLKQLAVQAEWDVPSINPETMGIEAKELEYRMLSESEKWRTDALLALAISQTSGIGVAIFDRFDVLDLNGRGQFIDLIYKLAQENKINTAIICGTLKSAPKLDGDARCYWVEDGTIA